MFKKMIETLFKKLGYVKNTDVVQQPAPSEPVHTIGYLKNASVVQQPAPSEPVQANSMPRELFTSSLYHALFHRIKSTDFPLECRGMYYFAKGRHAHQERKATGKPYFIHTRGVAYIVMKNGGTVDQINAALAHDLLEDTETSFPEIMTVTHSETCAELCAELRNNRFRIDEVGKDQYMTEKLLAMSDDAILIKLADMLYNSYDTPADKALTRMYHNICEVLLKRKLNGKCQAIAKLILLA